MVKEKKEGKNNEFFFERKNYSCKKNTLVFIYIRKVYFSIAKRYWQHYVQKNCFVIVTPIYPTWAHAAMINPKSLFDKKYKITACRESTLVIKGGTGTADWMVWKYLNRRIK